MNDDFLGLSISTFLLGGHRVGWGGEGARRKGSVGSGGLVFEMMWGWMKSLMAGGMCGAARRHAALEEHAACVIVDLFLVSVQTGEYLRCLLQLRLAT
jgi:hypothetical protein